MRLIDADALVTEYYKNPSYINLCTVINTAPTIDAVPVVRCKDCKWFRTYPNGLNDCIKMNERASTEWELCNEPEDYCSYGERKDER